MARSTEERDQHEHPYDEERHPDAVTDADEAADRDATLADEPAAEAEHVSDPETETDDNDPDAVADPDTDTEPDTAADADATVLDSHATAEPLDSHASAYPESDVDQTAGTEPTTAYEPVEVYGPADGYDPAGEPTEDDTPVDAAYAGDPDPAADADDQSADAAYAGEPALVAEPEDTTGTPEAEADRANDEPGSSPADAAAMGALAGAGVAAGTAYVATRRDDSGDERADDADVTDPDRAGSGHVAEEYGYAGPASSTVDDTPADADDEPAELMPGAVDEAPVGALFAADTGQALRDRLREVQVRFVDDPHGAAEDAAGLAGEAMDTLTAALQAQREDLDGWRGDSVADTEQLRIAVRRYRDFLDRLLNL